MTLTELEREITTLVADGEDVAAVVSDIDTTVLQLLASAIRLELLERYQGKPPDKARLH